MLPALLQWMEIFQSTRSARSATRVVVQDEEGHMISIHALRKERDPQMRAHAF